MASSGDAPKFPGPVDFKDNRKDKKESSDFATIYLEVPGLKVTSVPFCEAKPANAVISKTFTKGRIEVNVTLKKNGTSEIYQYNKDLPEDINPDDTEFKVKKDTVILLLCKAEQGSWAEHSSYFIRQGK